MKNMGLGIQALSFIPIVAILLVCGGCGQHGPEGGASQAASPLKVQTIHPHQGEIGRTITLPGNLLAYQQATLYAKVGGYLKTITVDKGDRVKAGDLLAEIEVPELVADRLRYNADVEVASLDFQRNLAARNKAPELVVAQAVDNAKGKYDVARANLDRAETLIGYGRITSPFPGIIIKRMVDPGAFIPAATSGSPAQTAAIVTVADLATMRVQTVVPEQETSFIHDGLPVSVTLEALPMRKFNLSLTRYSHALDESSKTMLVEAELPNPKEELLPGMYARVTIEVERHKNTTLIPAGALVTEKSGTSVFLLSDKHQAKKARVKVGFNDGSSVEILEGIKPDDLVIMAGAQPLSDGQEVQPAGLK